MNDLITRLSSILNLPKLAAISAPGIILAVALVILGLPGKDQTQSCLASALSFASKPKPPEAPKDPPKVFDYPKECLKLEPKTPQGCIAVLNVEIVKSEQKVNAFEARIKTADEDAKQLAERARPYTLDSGKVAQDSRAAAERALQGADAIRLQKGQAESATNLLKEERKRVDTYRTRLDGRVDAEPAAASKPAETPAKTPSSFIDTLLESTTQSLISLMVLAIVAGLLIEPIIRALLNTLMMEGGTKLYNTIFDRGVVSPSTIRRNYLAGKMDGDQVPYKVLDPRYAIGMRLITAEDVAGLEAEYLRQADVLGGMFLTLPLLFVAIKMRQNACKVGLEIGFWEIFLPLLLAFFTLERYHRYRAEVQKLIRGRWVKVQEDEAKADKQQKLPLEFANDLRAVLKDFNSQMGAAKEEIARMQTASGDLDRTRIALDDRLKAIEAKLPTPGAGGR